MTANTTETLQLDESHKKTTTHKRCFHHKKDAIEVVEGWFGIPFWANFLSGLLKVKQTWQKCVTLHGDSLDVCHVTKLSIYFFLFRTKTS